MRATGFVTAIRSVVFGAAVLAAGSASAFEWTTYTNALAEEARLTGRPYMLHIHADWCTTCQAQDRVLETLVDDPRFANLLVMTIDYDTKRNLMMLFNVGERSTFVGFAGTTELGRSMWDTTPEGITAFLQMVVDASPNYVPTAPAAAPPATPAPAPGA
ncbi:MAG: thioredoxin family protein [Bauldia sp.]|nr:thioredoxin family protein [Bauldia sp.]